MPIVDADEAIAAGAAWVSRDEAAAPVPGRRPEPYFMLGEPPAEFEGWFYGDAACPPAALYRLRDIAIRDIATLERDGARVALPMGGLRTWDGEGGIDEEVRFEGMQVAPAVLLTGRAYGMYGHWLIDFLPRLQVLRQLGLDPATLDLLLPGNIPPFAIRWLDLLGLARLRFHAPASARHRVAEALVPTGLRENNRASPLFAEAARWMRGRAIGDAPAPSGERLFVSRHEWGNRTRVLEDAEAVAACFSAAGYEVVVPERLPIEQQVALFARASVVVGEYGSALHNTIFSPPGTLVVALRGRFGHPGFLQSGLCEALGQRMAYVFGETTGTDGMQRYRVAPADLDAVVARLRDEA